MEVLLLTVFLSLLLALVFLMFFVFQNKKNYLGSVEQDALRPLTQEKTEVVSRK